MSRWPTRLYSIGVRARTMEIMLATAGITMTPARINQPVRHIGEESEH
ncbi:hypothetical protein [Streptomyces sp. NPDC007905]